MSSDHVSICKLRHAGSSMAQIADEMGVAISTVQRALANDKCKRLSSLLHLLRYTIDGPNKEQRQHMLWRIAVDNQSYSPKTAIKAIAEMNKMAGLTGGTGDGLTVIVQNTVLQPSALDEAG